jgi:hypothetical protein
VNAGARDLLDLSLRWESVVYSSTFAGNCGQSREAFSPADSGPTKNVNLPSAAQNQTSAAPAEK